MTHNPFSNGSRWLKADFHLHTCADKEFSYSGEDNSFVREYVEALQDAGVGLGVITNHNKFDHGEFKALRKRARKCGIGLLPGIELSVKDGAAGVHTLVVFSDEWITGNETNNAIRSFLGVTFAGRADFENDNARSNHGLIETVRELDKFEKEYFLVFAHVEQKHGLFKELSPGRVGELFANDSIRARALGFQKVRTQETSEKIRVQLGGWYPAEVEGSDAKNLCDMQARKCAGYLKLGDFGFQAVKFALQNVRHRTSKELPTYQHSHVKKITFEGAGILGGTEVDLSPELNAFIGTRGSGKSSVLEGLRYALGIAFGDKASDVDYKKALVQHLLRSGGKITLDVVDRRGQHYQIRRIFGEYPDVFVDDQLQPGISIRETALYNPIYFGQKDLSSTGAGFEKDLIEKLVGDALLPVRGKIDGAIGRVYDAIQQLRRSHSADEKKQEWQQKKQDAEFKLAFYREYGVEEKLKKQVDYDRDERKLDEVVNGTQQYLDALEEFIARFEDDLTNQRLYESKQNAQFFEQFFACYQQILDGFEQIKSELSTGRKTKRRLEQQIAKFGGQKKALKEEFAKIERKLAGELEQSGAQAISPGEFKTLTKTHDQAKQMLASLQDSEERQQALESELARELAGLDELWLEEYRIIEQALERINRVESPLRIVPQFKADKHAMLRHTQDTFRGSYLQKSTLQTLVDEYSDFGAIWRGKHNLTQQFGGSFDTFMRYLDENLDSLLTWQVPNTFAIEYYGKALSHHSLGQRASALMLFVLSQQDHDVVIIDQPEDDLDNQTIYEDIVKLVQRIKPATQFVFATHNANIPVLGDAEQVLACEYRDDQVFVERGTIDTPAMQKRIVNIMEGGAEAFNKRKQVYEAWKPTSC